MASYAVRLSRSFHARVRRSRWACRWRSRSPRPATASAARSGDTSAARTRRRRPGSRRRPPGGRVELRLLAEEGRLDPSARRRLQEELQQGRRVDDDHSRSSRMTAAGRDAQSSGRDIWCHVIDHAAGPHSPVTRSHVVTTRSDYTCHRAAIQPSSSTARPADGKLVFMPRLLESDDPAIRRLAGEDGADALASPRVRVLLNFPSVHPYTKWWGTHWRLVALADLRIPAERQSLSRGIEAELAWLRSPRHRTRIAVVKGLVRACASQEGNALYACSTLGFADDRRVGTLVECLLEWQWEDGGWNCDRRATGRRSSFHETVTPALGLAAYHAATGDADSLAAALLAAELLLEHRLFRSLRAGDVIHTSWTKPHYPPYWHYDILQGLRLLHAVGLLHDSRCQDALDLLERSRRRDGRFSGPAWWSTKQPDAVDWGRGPKNQMLNLLAESVLAAACGISHVEQGSLRTPPRW